MARYSRLEVFQTMLDTGLVPLFYNPDVEKGKRIIDACAEAGARCIEFVNRGDLAWMVFVELIPYIAANRPEIILGVGTVRDAATAGLYLNSGAEFVVSPTLNPEVAYLCNRRKAPYIPGCGSASEIGNAEELGAEIVKMFPGGQVGGPDFVKAVRDPMPRTNLMPAGGVSPTPESVGAWIKAGTACLGMGSKLIRKDLVENNDWDAIRKNVADCLELIRQARQG